MKPIRVLLLEDDPSDAELMVEELRRSGFEPHATRVDTRAELLTALGSEPDVILADNSLPGLDAASALALLQERDADTPLIVVSGTMDDEAAVALVRRGAADYVLKDRMVRLGEAVAGALERRELQASLRSQGERLERMRLQLEEAQRLARLGSWEVDLVTGRAVASEEMFRILGVEPQPEELTPEWFMEQVHPDDRTVMADDVRRVMEEGRSRPHELRIIRPDGEVRTVAVLIDVQTDAESTPIRMLGTVQDVTERRQAEDALRESERRARRLLTELVDAQEKERARIAGDIHDDAIQVVTAVGMRVAILRDRLSDPHLLEPLDRLGEVVSQAIARLRRLLFELRPRVLDEEGLAAALRQHLEMMGGDLEMHLEDRLVTEPSGESRTILYRVAQEALTNVRKHADARRVDLLLEERDGGFQISIRDDGKGFSPEEIERPRPGHLGLASMRERAEMAGGWFRLESAPGAGATVACWVPGVGRPTGRG